MEIAAVLPHAFLEVYNESQTVCKAHVREVQNHSPQGQNNGYMRKPEA
jgi:hypothetical protein